MISWPTEKRHKWWSESACGKYRVTRDADNVMLAWKAAKKSGVCLVPGCGRLDPCGNGKCHMETVPAGTLITGWLCLGASTNWGEIKGLLEGTLDEKGIQHGKKYAPTIRHFDPDPVSQKGDIPQLGHVDAAEIGGDTNLGNP